MAGPVAPLAGTGFFGASGGSGTNGLVLGRGRQVVPLAVELVDEPVVMSDRVVKMLCSTWPLADGLVQFDDPKITIVWSPGAVS